ncbi:SID1 transmembrane family member 1 [Anthophora retusa]
MLNVQKLLVIVTVLFYNSIEVISSRSESLSFIVIVAEYKKEYELIINSTIEYMFLYPVNNVTLVETAKIEVESNATHDSPLIVVARQKKGILSWQIPLVVTSMYFDNVAYNKTSRILCSNKYYSRQSEDQEEFVAISLSTANHQNISFKLNMTQEPNFYLTPGEKRTAEISPSQPIYYGYTFPRDVEDSVIVHVQSNSDICMTVSIQNTSCPVFDLERNIEFSGYWQTVSRQGGIIVPKEFYPLGFFVVLVVKSDDTDCYGARSMISPRKKTLTLTINASITKQDYIIASAIALTFMFIFCTIYVISVLVYKIKEGKKMKQEFLYQEHIEESIPGSSSIEELRPNQSVSSNDSSLDEDDIDFMQDAFSYKEVVRTKRVISVCDLARKNPKILMHKSRLYLFYLLTIAIFYTLPVIQLVITYQHVLHITGNQDMCYYNFLCAHPLGVVLDYNHLFSNFGYIMLGFLFIFLTYSREYNKFDRERNKCYGIPQHYGLFYAMGTALIMEGILSGSYHICPNRSNFQFDTSFMYVIVVLCMIKIYQTRHPDINARAPVTFGVLALIIFIELIGVLNDSTYFWIIFTIIHLLSCLFLNLQIYYMGQWKCGDLLAKVIQSCKCNIRSGITCLFPPSYPKRFIMLVIGNLCNVVLAIFGNIYREQNFAGFLLAILMSNLILYILFYIVMKICHKERILFQPSIYIILSIVLWAGALYFFINKTISWAVTPAQSRLHNKPCKLLNFFDSHDIWHFLSAFAMFFSFMVLLTLDDDLIDVHRSQISVF